MLATPPKSGASFVDAEKGCRITSLLSIQLDEKSDPSSLLDEKKAKITELLTQALRESSFPELQQEGSVKFKCNLTLSKGFYLCFEGKGWKKVASFRPFFKREAASQEGSVNFECNLTLSKEKEGNSEAASQEDFSVHALYEEIKCAIKSNAFPNSERAMGRDRAFEDVQEKEKKLQEKEKTSLETASGYVACTGDAVGLTAYSIGLIARTAAAHLIAIAYLIVGSIASFISIGTGVVIANSAMKQRVESSKVDDHEGVRLAKAFEVIGCSLGAVGAGFTAFKVSALAGAAKVSTLILHMTLPFCILLSIAVLIHRGISLVGSLSFQKKLDACLQDPDNLKQTLMFLRDQITGSDIEAKEVRGEIRHKIKEVSKDQRREKAQVEWEKHIKKNALKLGRRTSPEVAKKVLLTVNRLLKELGDDSVSPEDTIREAKNLIEEVRKENFKTTVKNIIIIVAAILGILNVIAILTTTGPFSLVVLLLFSALWFSFDTSLANRFGEVLWAKKL